MGHLFPVAVPKISSSLLAHEISTAATRSGRFSRHRRRSHRSPSVFAFGESTSLIRGRLCCGVIRKINDSLLQSQRSVSSRTSAHAGVAIPESYRNVQGIATPVLGLARNDMRFNFCGVGNINDHLPYQSRGSNTQSGY